MYWLLVSSSSSSFFYNIIMSFVVFIIARLSFFHFFSLVHIIPFFISSSPRFTIDIWLFIPFDRRWREREGGRQRCCWCDVTAQASVILWLLRRLLHFVPSTAVAQRVLFPDLWLSISLSFTACVCASVNNIQVHILLRVVVVIVTINILMFLPRTVRCTGTTYC